LQPQDQFQNYFVSREKSEIILSIRRIIFQVLIPWAGVDFFFSSFAGAFLFSCSSGLPLSISWTGLFGEKILIYVLNSMDQFINCENCDAKKFGRVGGRSIPSTAAKVKYRFSFQSQSLFLFFPVPVSIPDLASVTITNPI